MRSVGMEPQAHTSPSGYSYSSRRSSQPLVVRATLVGPDPRLIIQPSSSSSSPSSSSSLLGAKLRGPSVEELAMQRCIKLHQQYPQGVNMPRRKWQSGLMEEAYARCGAITSEYAKTFYLGTQLMTPVQAKGVWAIYVWCRRTDELVDGPNASRITPKVSSPTRSPATQPQRRERHRF